MPPDLTQIKSVVVVVGGWGRCQLSGRLSELHSSLDLLVPRCYTPFALASSLPLT